MAMSPEEKRRRKAEHRLRNLDAIRARNREYMRRNKEKYGPRSKAYHAAHAEELREKRKAYNADPAVKARAKAWSSRDYKLNRDEHNRKSLAWYHRNRDRVLPANRARVRSLNARRRADRFAEALKLAAATGENPMTRRHLERMLADEAKELRDFASKLGCRMRHVLVYLTAQRIEAKGSGVAALVEEVDALGVRWEVAGSLLFRNSITASLAHLERRGFVMRQSVINCMRKGAKRTDPGQRIEKTSHVQILPKGLVVGERLLDRHACRRKLARWEHITPAERADVVSHLIEWRCRIRQNPRAEVIALTRCLKTGEDPVVVVLATRNFGREEITWEHVPKRLEQSNLP